MFLLPPHPQIPTRKPDHGMPNLNHPLLRNLTSWYAPTTGKTHYDHGTKRRLSYSYTVPNSGLYRTAHGVGWRFVGAAEYVVLQRGGSNQDIIARKTYSATHFGIVVPLSEFTHTSARKFIWAQNYGGGHLSLWREADGSWGLGNNARVSTGIPAVPGQAYFFVGKSEATTTSPSNYHFWMDGEYLGYDSEYSHWLWSHRIEAGPGSAPAVDAVVLLRGFVAEAWPDEEIVRISKNPWELFAPDEFASWVPMAASGVLVPTLSLPGVTDITPGSARPKVTLTF